jgi:ATP-dependent Clp protease ATP-binding subunit ClpC
LAQEEARTLNHNYIGTEHILLGLVHEDDGVAAKVFRNLDISSEAVRQQVEQIIGRGEISPGAHIPFTPRAKKALELSLRESLHLGHNHIGTEHILLGLLRESEGVAAKVIVRLGVDLNRVRKEVIRLVSGKVSDEGIGDLAGAAEREFETFDEVIVLLRDIARRVKRIEQRLAGDDPADDDEAHG